MWKRPGREERGGNGGPNSADAVLFERRGGESDGTEDTQQDCMRVCVYVCVMCAGVNEKELQIVRKTIKDVLVFFLTADPRPFPVRFPFLLFKCLECGKVNSAN